MAESEQSRPQAQVGDCSAGGIRPRGYCDMAEAAAILSREE
jgi:hypothetical protein